MTRSVFLIISFVFIDLLGYSLFLPLLPYYAGDLGASPTLIGLMVASNALAQFIASPLVGRFSDRFGRRPMLIVSIVGTLVSFVMLGLVEPIGSFLYTVMAGQISRNNIVIILLFASRVLDGLAGGNTSLARAYITDITDEQNRAKSLGLIGASFGMGFIIGPALGGFLSNWGWVTSLFETAGLSRYAVPSFAAAVLSLFNLVGVILWLPESLSKEERQELSQSPHTAVTARAMFAALKRVRFSSLLATRFVYTLAFALFTANFSLYAQYHLELTDQTTSYILAYIGVLVVLVQGMAIGPLTKRFSETRLIFNGVILLGLALLFWAFVPSIVLLLVILAPLALSAGVLNTVTNSAISKSVYREEVGGAMGLSEGFNSLARVVAPAVGGVLLERAGAPSLGILGAAIMFGLTLFVWRVLVVRLEEPLPSREIT